MAEILTPTTRLQAVNTMLALIGEAPVNTLSGSLTADTQLAVTLLDETNREVQAIGWQWNTDEDYDLTPDSNSNIIVPSNALRMTFDRAQDPWASFVQRGTKLYDRKQHTYEFSDTVTVKELVLLLSFEDLPEAARRYIALRAARKFANNTMTSTEIHGLSERAELDARSILEDAESDTRPCNVLNTPGLRDVFRR